MVVGLLRRSMRMSNIKDLQKQYVNTFLSAKPMSGVGDVWKRTTMKEFIAGVPIEVSVDTTEEHEPHCNLLYPLAECVCDCSFSKGVK